MILPEPIWYPSAEVDAQCSHVGWGVAAITGLGMHWGLGPAVAVLAGWILVKEWGFDIVIEKDGWQNSLRDSLFYVAGGVLGSFVLVW